MRSGNYHKIGCAKNPKKRLKQLQTGNPEKIVLVKTKELDSPQEAMFYERHFQEHYPGKRVSGEWYDLNDIELRQLFGMVA